MSGGEIDGSFTREVWRLGLERLRWERLANLTRARSEHVCCVVRGGTLVSLGGSIDDPDDEIATASVETQHTRAAGEAALSRELPQLSCGASTLGRALVVDESESVAGQVLHIGGSFASELNGVFQISSEVWSVDLATGLCTPQPPLREARSGFVAARLPGGRIVCAGDEVEGVSAEMWEPAQGQGQRDAPGHWRPLPSMDVERSNAAGCVLSDGRFAVLGGADGAGAHQSSCEALALDGVERWEPMPPMHQARVPSRPRRWAGA